MPSLRYQVRQCHRPARDRCRFRRSDVRHAGATPTAAHRSVAGATASLRRKCPLTTTTYGQLGAMSRVSSPACRRSSHESEIDGHQPRERLLTSPRTIQRSHTENTSEFRDGIVRRYYRRSRHVTGRNEITHIVDVQPTLTPGDEQSLY